MPEDLPTLALYVNFYNIPENAADGTLDKWLKKTNKILPARDEHIVLEAVDVHPLNDADFLPPGGSRAVADGNVFSAEIKDYRVQTKSEVSNGGGHHHHHHD